MTKRQKPKSGDSNWKVSLRVKSLLAILLAVICVFVVMTIIVDPIINVTFSQEEIRETEGKLQQARAALQSEFSDLSNVNENWASRDDTYAFVADGNEGYIRSNLDDSTFLSDRLNLVLFLAADGKVVWGNSYDTVRSKQEPVPPLLLDYLTHRPITEMTITGILTASPDPIMISASPVLTSSGKGPVRGTLILGRSLDQLEIQHLNKVSRLSINLFTVGNPANPADVTGVAGSIKKDVAVVRPLSSNNIRGYTILSDIDERPAIVFTVDVPRTTYQNGMNMWQYFKMALIGISVIYASVTVLIMELSVLAPISYLSERVRDIGLSGRRRIIAVGGHDEVSGLGDTISGMLDALDESKKTLEDSEARFRLLAENARDVIYRVEVSPARKFVYLSPALKDVTGYHPEELYRDYGLFLNMIHPDDRRAFQENLRDAPPENSPIVMRFVRRDGGIIWIEASNLITRSETGEVFAEGVARDITERKRVEEDLKASEEKFRNLIDNAPVGIAITDSQGEHALRNKYLQEMYGYSSKEELDRVPVTENYFDPADRERYLELSRRGPVRDFEIRLRRKDGSVIWGSLTSIPHAGREGEQIITIIEDITERKQAERQLELESHLLDAATDSIILREFNDGTFGKPVYVNMAAYLTRGYTREEFMEMENRDVIHPENATQFGPRIIGILEKGEATYQSVQRRRNGDTMPVEIHARIITLDGKKYILSVVRDITERKRAEEEINNIAKFPGEDPSPVMRITRGGEIVYANKSSLPLLKIWQGESGDALPKRVPENLIILAQGSVNAGLVKEIEVASGDTIYSLAFTPVVNEDYINIYGYDITERKRAEEERNKLFKKETELRKALEEEIEKRAEFTRALVHELKTPLTPVLASSDLLIEELSAEPYLSLAKNINRGAVNLNNRIDELLDLARGEIGMLRLNSKHVDTARLLREVFEFTAPSALSANEFISLEMPGALPEVVADEERLRQVLLNFINNAIKYSDPGSKILIRANVEGENLVFQIKDTGHGLDEKEKERLFQPYHRLVGDRERLSGLGLGLALSKTLIELHHGRVWVESQKGVGSTFGFSIPLTQ